ncbi:low molecular weight protein-tyrosine-phosphatase [Larsenimonas suaedae]|uniref:protein-tyrosine-phosphatase n=1 Tax=Larsenimonas suaedae TaxID=1851019 RepID=A0ABU1GUU9_9GAMM|nr:low molecular weight protein-tyrosine-phosphatase [Larsenimonas suaedae]MCM2971110.1 low molecular weight phosphotyrosine protein phosphatase [Larsenimonas suaedae]MDR5895819.1 low molecular weight phosphotyrosine protein phosphatase [Larsenimonas suaedae]
MSQTVRVLFVCLGNICRSPTAEGIFRDKVAARGLDERFEIDSCGTGDWHAGSPPDARARQEATRRGINIDHLRARELRSSDFEDFDWILVMDNDNLANVARRCPADSTARYAKLLSWTTPAPGDDVPDPYRGNGDDFSHVYDLIERACDAFIDERVAEHQWSS